MINLLFMIFMHIIDDYYLQSILLSLKQKSWWEKNYPQKKYKYDYLIALFMHSFSWSIMIMMPSIIQHKFILWVFIINLLIHFIVDHLKANLQKINLITDQTIHLIQIILTYLICF